MGLSPCDIIYKNTADWIQTGIALFPRSDVDGGGGLSFTKH